MSCEVAMLPFQEHANYGTWSIDFGRSVHNPTRDFLVFTNNRTGSQLLPSLSSLSIYFTSIPDT